MTTYLKVLRLVTLAVWTSVGAFAAVAVEIAPVATTCRDLGCNPCRPGECCYCAQIGDAYCLTPCAVAAE